jgi:hypothetical protein
MSKSFLCVWVCLLYSMHLVNADLTPEQPAELTSLKAEYQNKIQDAIKPIQDSYRDDLKRLLQTELLKGDAVAAIAVKKEILTTLPGYPFTGTWSNKDGSSVIEFSSGGVYSEKWNGQIVKGHWKADDYSDCTVNDPDNPAGSNYVVLHFHLNESGDLVRDMNNQEYRFVESPDPL